LSGILQQLDELAKQDGQFAPFIEEVRGHAKKYDMKRIREVLKGYLS